MLDIIDFLKTFDLKKMDFKLSKKQRDSFLHKSILNEKYINIGSQYDSKSPSDSDMHLSQTGPEV